MQSIKKTFKKQERLKSKKKITELFDHGQIIHHYPFKILYEFSNAESEHYPAQLAISVSKRYFKKAVDRNYIKRKIREAYRLNKHKLYKSLLLNNQMLYLFVIYTVKQDMDSNDIEKSIRGLLQKLVDRAAKN